LITTGKTHPRLRKLCILFYGFLPSEVPRYDINHEGNRSEATSGERHSAIMTNVIFSNLLGKVDQK